MMWHPVFLDTIDSKKIKTSWENMKHSSLLTSSTPNPEFLCSVVKKVLFVLITLVKKHYSRTIFPRFSVKFQNSINARHFVHRRVIRRMAR